MPAINSNSQRSYDAFLQQMAMSAEGQPERVGVNDDGDANERINRAYRTQQEAWMQQHGLTHESFGSARSYGALDRLYAVGSKPLKGRPFK